MWESRDFQACRSTGVENCKPLRRVGAKRRARRFLLWSTPPRPCEPSCWPSPPLLPVCVCGEISQPRTRPADCLFFCSKTACAPCTNSLRRYLFHPALYFLRAGQLAARRARQERLPARLRIRDPLESRSITDRRDRGCRSERSDAGDRDQAPAGSPSSAISRISLSDSSICLPRYCISNCSCASSTRNMPGCYRRLPLPESQAEKPGDAAVVPCER